MACRYARVEGAAVATGAEPMRAPGWELFAEWHALIESADPRFTWVGNVNDAAEAVARLAAQTTTSAWNMQRHNTTSPGAARAAAG